MQQKVIVRVSMADEKSRKKAMRTVVGHYGVVSAALTGNEKNQIEVVGEGIDSVAITTLLRKKVGHAELVSVNPIPVKKDEPPKKEEDNKNKNQNVTFQQPLPYVVWNYPPNCFEVRENYNDNCSIM